MLIMRMCTAPCSLILAPWPLPEPDMPQAFVSDSHHRLLLIEYVSPPALMLPEKRVIYSWRGRLALGLDFGARADTLCLRSLQMMCRNPTLVVGLCAACHSRTIGADNANLIGRVDLLRPSRGLLGPLATLAASTLLWIERGNPGIVDEKAGTAESSC